MDYGIVWRYFSWTNQTLAMIVLWTASMYLYKAKKNYWLTAVPATFMSAVSMTYFFCAKECFKPRYCSCVPGRYRNFAVVFLWNLHPRNEETDSIMKDYNDTKRQAAKLGGLTADDVEKV